MPTLKYINGYGEELAFKNAKPIILVSIDGLNSPTTNMNTMNIPNQDGTTYLGSTVKQLDLSIKGLIVADDENEILELKKHIANILSPKKGKGKLRYEYDTGEYKETDAVVEGITFIENLNEKGLFSQKFYVDILCPSPFWRAIEESEILAFQLGGFEFPLQLPTRFSNRKTKGVITNDGDVETPVLIKFYGPATTPTIYNNTTGEFIKLNKSLEDGEVLTVNTEFGNKKVEITTSDGTTTSAFQYLDLNSTFWQLVIGDNEVEFNTGDATEDARVEIYYRKRYLVV